MSQEAYLQAEGRAGMHRSHNTAPLHYWGTVASLSMLSGNRSAPMCKLPSSPLPSAALLPGRSEQELLTIYMSLRRMAACKQSCPRPQKTGLKSL